MDPALLDAALDRSPLGEDGRSGAHLERVRLADGRRVVVKRYDAARSEAREIDRRRLAGEVLPPLAGVPVTIKDCIDVAGLPSTFGLPSRANSIAAADEMHVERLRQAGAVVLGKTNVAQLLIYAESDNPLYGRTVNPWNPERTCGGSSGGEGAIIAAGGAPMGLGTDIGGSVRYPATFCGVAGLKPTAGRCPDYAGLNLPLGQRERNAACEREMALGVFLQHIERRRHRLDGVQLDVVEALLKIERLILRALKTIEEPVALGLELLDACRKLA